MNNEARDERIVRLDEGIYLIPGRSGGGCNVYVLKGERKVALIDLGLPEDHEDIEAALAEIDLSFDDVSLAILTHEHIDHVGGLPRLPKHVVVAAHARAANKLRLDDQFSMMSGAFKAGRARGEVDIHLEDGTLIDLGGLRVRVIYTPGHCSGAICLFEPERGALFTADTIFAGGIVGGIFASGNVSDYIDSLERLREFRLETLYPGHGRASDKPYDDIERGLHGSRLLIGDTHMLFDSINARGAFKRMLRGTVEYSRRAAERRTDARLPMELSALAHLEDADHPVIVQNISLAGVRIDRVLAVKAGERVEITLDGVGTFDSHVVGHVDGHTRLRFHTSSADYPRLREWLQQHRQARTRRSGVGA